MKKMIKKSILFLSVIGLCSCNDFLKEASQDEVIPSTIEDLDQLLAYEGYPRYDRQLMPYLDILADDATQYITSNNQISTVTNIAPCISGEVALQQITKRCSRITRICRIRRMVRNLST